MFLAEPSFIKRSSLPPTRSLVAFAFHSIPQHDPPRTQRIRRGSDNAGINVLMAPAGCCPLLPRAAIRETPHPGGCARMHASQRANADLRTRLKKLRYLQAGVLSCGSRRALDNEPCKSHYRQLNYHLKALFHLFARAIIVKVPRVSRPRSPQVVALAREDKD